MVLSAAEQHFPTVLLQRQGMECLFHLRRRDMIEYRNVKKSYGSRQIIQGVDLTVEKGEFVVLIGPSGCGKTTTLKMLNRLIEPSEGSIWINGVDHRELDLVKLRTSIGYVIQQIGLFPNMTVEENIAVVPRIMKWEKGKTLDRVKELLNMVNMPYNEYGRKYPKELSGGQQQRIGVLRALAVNPPVILMDEPFGALDPITREILQSEVKKIQKELKITILFVTHDMQEAMKMADRIVFMDQGRILQQAPPEELLRRPANDTVARFIALQGIGGKKSCATAAELMQPAAGIRAGQDAVIVAQEERIEEIVRKHDLSGCRRICVKDSQGALVGEITVGSLLSHLTE